MASAPRTRKIRAALNAASDLSWLALARHDDEGGTGDGEGDTGSTGDTGTEGDTGSTGDDTRDGDDAAADDAGLGDKGKETLRKLREQAKAAEKKARDEARARAAAEKKVAEFEDAQKDDLEKAQDAAKKAADRAEAAERRAVLAEIRALASADFADVSDATDALAGRLSEFVGDDGEIDAEAITAALAEKLQAKPHWKKAPTKQDDAGEKKGGDRKRQGDPGQGSGRGGGTGTPDFASDHDAYAAEARRLGLRVPHRAPTR